MLRSGVCLVLITLLISFSLAQQTVQGTFGTAVQLSANTDTKINFLAGLGPQLNIQVDSACSVTVTQITSFTALPNNAFTSLNLGTEVGYEIKQSGNCKIVSASLQTGTISLTIVTQLTAAITAGGNVGCLYYNTSVFSRVAVQPVSNSFAQGLVIQIPRFGQYIFVTYSQNIPLPTLYADVQIVGGAQGGGGASGSGRTVLSFSDGLILAVTTSTQAALTASTYSSLSGSGCSCSDPDTKTYKAYGQWFNFNLNATNNFNAEINKTYSAQTLTSLGVTDETQLRLGYYDTSSNQWVFPTNQHVDTSAKVVACTSTHFSTWGMYAQGTWSTTSSDASTSQNVLVAFVAMMAFALAMLML
jgi:hypothetical protein